MVACTAAFALLAALPSVFASRYVIKPAAFDDLCVVPANTTNGSDIVLGKCTGDLIYWTLKENALVNGNNTCLDQRNGAENNGNLLQLWECFEPNANQEFDILVPNKHNATAVYVQWKEHKYCLDLTDGKGEEGTKIQVWDCIRGNTHQQWNFYDVTKASGDEEIPDIGDDSAGVYDGALAAYFAVNATANATAPDASAAPESHRRRHTRRVLMGSH